MTATEPLVVGIGVQKCGTSSTSELLQNCGVEINTKELHFAGKAKNRDEYLRRFGRISSPTFGEFTPNYIFDPYALHFLGTTLRTTKFIIQLRDPVERFYSMANHARGNGYLNPRLSARQLLEQSLKPATARATGWSRNLVAHGFYGSLVARAFRFLPLARLHVTFLEDLSGNQSEQFTSEMVEFLELRPKTEALQFEKVNERDWHLGKRDLVSLQQDPGVNRDLREIYSPSMKKLGQILERDLPWRF